MCDFFLRCNRRPHKTLLCGCCGYLEQPTAQRRRTSQRNSYFYKSPPPLPAVACCNSQDFNHLFRCHSSAIFRQMNIHSHCHSCGRCQYHQHWHHRYRRERVARRKTCQVGYNSHAHAHYRAHLIFASSLCVPPMASVDVSCTLIKKIKAHMWHMFVLSAHHTLTWVGTGTGGAATSICMSSPWPNTDGP